MADFLMSSRAEKGAPIAIKLPDGKDSGHTITVRGIDSDSWRVARAKRSRASAEIMGFKDDSLTPEEISAVHAKKNHKADMEMLSSLVVSWSFEEQCTPESTMDLLMGCPMIATQIDVEAGKQGRFFGKPSSN